MKAADFLHHNASVVVVGSVSVSAVSFITYFTKGLYFATTEAKFHDLITMIYLSTAVMFKSGSSGASDKEWQIKVLFPNCNLANVLQSHWI